MLGGEFAPGATAEAAPGISEIEINVSLGDTTDELTVAGTSGDDTIRLGMSGVNLNSDTDRDISFAQVPNVVTIYGGSGNNTLSAKGGFGSGTIYLGQGRDHQRERRRPDPGRLRQRRARTAAPRTSRSRVRTATTRSTAAPATTSCSVRAATTT